MRVHAHAVVGFCHYISFMSTFRHIALVTWWWGISPEHLVIAGTGGDLDASTAPLCSLPTAWWAIVLVFAVSLQPSIVAHLTGISHQSSILALGSHRAFSSQFCVEPMSHGHWRCPFPCQFICLLILVGKLQRAVLSTRICLLCKNTIYNSSVAR